MKKRFMAFVSLILTVLLMTACFSGCRLFTTDNERDVNQVVATVNVNDKQENIYKKDLILQYLNYGYAYVQNYGYTVEDTYKLILNQMISSKILTQGAMLKLEELNKIENSDKAKNDPERYLSDKKIVDVEYNTYKNVNEMLEAALKAQDNKQDAIFDATRTTPTNASVKEVKLTHQEKIDYVEKGFDISSDKEHRKAFNSIIDLFSANGLLGKDYNGTIESTDYFKSTKASLLESEVVSVLESVLTVNERKTLTFEKIEQIFNEEKEEQTSWSNQKFAEALSSASVEKPVLYSGFGSYGFVQNLLLGVNEEQERKIANIREENPNISDSEYANERAKILGSTLVSDLRSGWILSGYDLEEITVGAKNKLIFTGDYTFAKDSANSLPFQGEFKKIKEADEEKKTPAKYTVTDVYTYELDQFITFMDGYLGGSSSNNKSAYSSLGASVYGAKKLNGVDEYKEKINELLFAFSTDDGSLNTYDGYVIKPAVDGANKEEYVKTFGDAGRILLEQGTGYVIVASDFGYHVMFYSEKFGVDYSVDSLVEYLNKSSGENRTREQWISYYEEMIEDWENFEESEGYLYYSSTTLTDGKVVKALDQIERELINANRYEESDKVSIYMDRISDLWSN